MKISSGGIGTVASAQASNAKSAFPYIWAWNAIGETHQDDGGSGQAVLRPAGMVSGFTSVGDGIKITLNTGGASATKSPYWDLKDDLASNVSGLLNQSDTSIGRYMHGIFDFTNAPSIVALSLDFKELFWYQTDDKYAGHNAILEYTMPNGKTVFVWDMFATPYSETGTPDAWRVVGDQPLAPITLEPYFEGVVKTETFVHCGFVLSDRILTDIPLPVRTHMG